MVLIFVFSVGIRMTHYLLSNQTTLDLEEGQYIEYTDNVFKVISLSDDKEYVIVEDVLSKTFPLRLLKVTNYIKPVDTEIVEKYLELKNYKMEKHLNRKTRGLPRMFNNNKAWNNSRYL